MALLEQQRLDLEKSLRAAYDYDRLDRAFTYRLGKGLHEFVAREGFEDVIFKLITRTEREGWTRRLVRIAVDQLRGNPDLITFVQTYPEFDRTITPLELEDLQVGFSGAFPTYPQFRGFIKKRLRTDIEEFTSTDSNSASWAEQCIPRVIYWFDDQNQVDRLIEAALQENPADGALRAKAALVLRRLRRRAGAAPQIADQFDACLLDGQVFMDRKNLREAVRVLANTTQKRVVAVKGASGSGKSYSCTFIRHIETKHKQFEVVQVDLNGMVPSKLTPEKVARSIVRQMGRNESLKYLPEQEESPAAWWVRELCDFVVGEVKASGKMLFIVLDGFQHADLHPDTREMVKELVVRAANNPILRVALLNYSSDLLPVSATARVVAEEIAPFTRDQVRETLKKIGLLYGEDPDDDILNDMVDDVWQSVDEKDPEHTRKIAGKVNDWAQKMADHAREEE